MNNIMHNLLTCECSECINYWVDLTNNMTYTESLAKSTGETYKMKLLDRNDNDTSISR